MPVLDGPILSRPTWAFAALLTGLMLVLVVLPPVVPEAARMGLYTAFSTVCHQMDARSFHLHGHAFAVCHRCTGIFAGLFIGTLLWPFVRAQDPVLARHAARLLACSLLPTALDWGLGVTGVWANTPLSRTLTGALFGAMAGVYLSRGFTRTGTPVAVRPHLDLSHPTHPSG